MTPPPVKEARSLKEISPMQWRTGLASWLGWFFDGLEMHLYTLVAAPFVMQLVHASAASDPLVKSRSSWIQAAFLVGWALGGGFFGRIGDRIGRTRTLALTVLFYAIFTGASFFADTWWQLMIFRFLSALGIGGEWAVGSSLLSETWPKRWRPWIAAVLQSGVNLGVILACAVVWIFSNFSENLRSALNPALPSGWDIFPRCVFLVGVLPAVLVWWIRRHVPEPEEWTAAKSKADDAERGSITALFKAPLRKITLLSMVVCASGLTGWWAFMFWHNQHIRNLPELATWPAGEREKALSMVFAGVIGLSVVGNFFCGWLAQRFGYRKSIFWMFAGLGLSCAAAHLPESSSFGTLWKWYVAIGFFSGVFGLFTMYLPPLFPTLQRTTGAGFCYNIGRIAAAAGTVYFGLFSSVGDFRGTLLAVSVIFIPGMIAVVFMPEPTD